MANQLNFPEPLKGTSFQRPSRINNLDANLIRDTKKQILFGASLRDVVELWIYNPDGTLASHLNLGALDTALTLTTLIDNTGPYEVLNIDMKAVANRLVLDPGRYSFVANFFRDEVGSEDTYKLYIADMSPDRTELKLQSIRPTPEILKDIFEFVVPSVPRLFANGLIDQMFGKSLDSHPEERIDIAKIDAETNKYASNTVARLKYAGIYERYVQTVNSLLSRIYSQTLQNMANDVNNNNIQKIELENYLFQAVSMVIHQMQSAGEFDTQLVLV